MIVPYADGPYLVRGPAVIRDQDGVRIDPGRRTFALCRCGKSRMRPFCDGTHQLVRFTAPSQPEVSAVSASRPASLRKRNGSVGPAVPPRRTTRPGDADRERVESQLRVVQRQLNWLIEELAADPTQNDGLAALTAQLSTIVARLESETSRC